MERARKRTRKKTRRGVRGRSRGGARPRRGRRGSSRPQILQFRWWMLIRSRHGIRTALLGLLGLVVAFVAFRRVTAHEEPPAAPFVAPAP